jgi:succinyl-CoA synthetase beta subunit
MENDPVKLLEHQGKAILAAAGLPVPPGWTCSTPDDAFAAADGRGPVVVKAQVPAGGRGKAGGIVFAADAAHAKAAAGALLGSRIGGHRVDSVLVEPRLAIARETYAAVLADPATRGPLLLFAPDGGMDVESAAATHPAGVRRLAIDILNGPSDADLSAITAGLDAGPALAACLAGLYRVWREQQAALLEVNPLAVLADGSVTAADCKLVLDRPGPGDEDASPLEQAARALGLNFIELGGAVGVLANGAGLTMATVDMVRHFGGRPANFLEIGGEAYTKARDALALLLGKPGLKSLVVNFCGAYARTDVMAGGVVDAWTELAPSIPVFFSIHGTGEDEAVELVRRRLGTQPFERAEDAVRAAVEAAR